MLSEGVNKAIQCQTLRIDEEGMKEIKYCPGTLAEGFDKYSPLRLEYVFLYLLFHKKIRGMRKLCLLCWNTMILLKLDQKKIILLVLINMDDNS
ncbi:MAG: hypothetical protein H6Q15_2266 [Bacteroidetes bacterium]|nr:hypothetical protein [Bacteroidota bacterium]